MLGDARTGLEVVREAQRRGIHVRAGVRDVHRAAALGLHPGPLLDLVQLDVVTSSAQSLVDALTGVSVAVCCVGFAPTYAPAFDRAQSWAVDAEGVSRLVEAAEAAGVHRFVLVSSLLTNAPTAASFKVLNTLGGVLAAKHAAEQRLRASSMAYSILRPGVFASRPQVTHPEAFSRGPSTPPCLQGLRGNGRGSASAGFGSYVDV